MCSSLTYSLQECSLWLHRRREDLSIPAQWGGSHGLPSPCTEGPESKKTGSWPAALTATMLQNTLEGYKVFHRNVFVNDHLN